MSRERSILSALAKSFTYRADPGMDWWRVCPRSGPVIGDCEDFALTLAFRLAGGSWPRFFWQLLIRKSVIWYCTTSTGGGHAVLWHRGAGWADNIFPNWSVKPRHLRRWPFPVFAVVLKLITGWFLRALDEHKNVQGAQKGGGDDR